MNILAIIPARGGSKGIPHKNIQKLAGKPLIYYSINSAKISKCFNKIIVSTDDEKIAKISKGFGAEVPFLRPKNISKDSSSTIEVIKHTLEFLKKNQNYIPDIIIVLQPTSPLRTLNLIKSTIQILKKSGSTSVISVSKIKKHPFSAFWLKSGLLKPFKQNFTEYNRRQKYPDLYFPTGSIYAFWNKTIKKYNSMYGPKIKPIVIDIENIDIDNKLDLFIAEMIIKNWNKYKKRFD
jgi:CMP-N,N'-diacetyllegionaminic acid synthase